MIGATRSCSGLAASAVARPLTGQAAIVSGAATGIGAAIAWSLAEAGATVVINYLDEDRQARGLVARISGRNGSAIAVRADLRARSEVAAMMDQLRGEIGHVDILVNNAGCYPRVPWTDLTEEHWYSALEVNLTAHYRLTRIVAPMMIPRLRGRIINIGSVTARAGRTGLVAYAAAKEGLVGFTRSLARELGPFGICVNAVLPGAIQVERETMIPTEHRTPPEVQIERQCISRRGQPEDIGAAVAFLAGPGASFITGQSLHVDGGWILH